jgi:hypothetical protein
VALEDDPKAQREAYLMAQQAKAKAESGGVAFKPSGSASAAQLGGKLLGLHLLLWSGLAMALGAAAISSEVRSVGDSVLCWGLARWQYVLGKMISRAVVAGGLVVGLTLPTLWVFTSRTHVDLVWVSAIKTTFLVALVLMAMTIIGVAIGSWFRSSIRAVGLACVAWFGAGLLAMFLGGPAYSPTSFASQFPSLLAGVDPLVSSSLPTATALVALIIGSVSTFHFWGVDL